MMTPFFDIIGLGLVVVLVFVTSYVHSTDEVSSTFYATCVSLTL